MILNNDEKRDLLHPPLEWDYTEEETTPDCMKPAPWWVMVVLIFFHAVLSVFEVAGKVLNYFGGVWFLIFLGISIVVLTVLINGVL